MFSAFWGFIAPQIKWVNRQYNPVCPFRSILPGLRECATDDDVAMHLIKHTEGFEKYLHYMVGQTQAEDSVTDKAIQQYFEVCTKSVWFYEHAFSMNTYF